MTIEIFTCFLLFKNFFSFALTWKAYGWLSAQGTYYTFMAVGSIQVAVCLISIPMCKSLPPSCYMDMFADETQISLESGTGAFSIAIIS